jgi:glycosyltransferase involved in cell wall biosynthesis
LQAVKEADYVVVLDTGSTDGTWEYLKSQQGIITAQKIINPWRFDTARNEALKLIPKDCEICMPLDIDMFVINGFGNIIKQFWEKDLGILEYGSLFVNTGKVATWFAHTRSGAKWKYPVYEQIYTAGHKKITSKILINNEWKIKENHKLYLPLIDIALTEYPNKKEYFLKAKEEILRNIELLRR